MKAGFLLLVLLNLAYLGWQTWIVPSQAPPAFLDTKDVPRLLLVGEDPDNPVATEPYSFAPPRNEPAKEQLAKTVVAAGTDSDKDDPARQTQADVANDSVADAAIAPEPKSPESNIATDTVVDAAAAPEVEIAVASATAGLRCVSLGPFLNLREATEATAMLNEAGLDPSQRLSESQVWFGHWVHLPPLDTRAAAIAVVEDLRTKGVSDIYIEPSGPMENSISLGVFSDREHAETRAGTIRRLGISPQIRDRYRDSSVYWVDFELPEGQVIDPTAYQASPRRVLRIEGRTCPNNT